MLFLAQQLSLKSSHIPFLPVCPSSCRTKDREPWNELSSLDSGPDHTHTHTHWSQQRKYYARRPVLTAVWVSQWCRFNKWLFLSASVQWHKRTIRACARVRWLQHSTAFSTPFTRKSRDTDTPEQWNHTNTKGKQSHYTQGSMGKFLTTSTMKGGV